MQVFIYCKIALHVSGVICTHHQEGNNLPPWPKDTLEEGCCSDYYDLYQRLQLVLCTPDDWCDGRPKHVE
jgi:hypothetical protein